MRTYLLFLCTAFIFCNSCKEDKGECMAAPVPFRFKIVDEQGDNWGSDPINYNNFQLFYHTKKGDSANLEINKWGNKESTYFSANMLPWISAGDDIKTFYLKSEMQTDTLYVNVFDMRGGCSNFYYGDVLLNGDEVKYDTTVTPPVYIIIH